jgi:hypothetical protein
MTKRAQIDRWPGPPALSIGASAEDFRLLSREIDNEIAPSNIFEKLEVRDISHKIAEEQTLKRMQTAIVMSARVESLVALLEPTFGQNIEKARKTAQDYFSGSGESKSVAKELVDRLGISMENIDASALHLRMTSIHALDDMIDRREGRRNRIIKRLLKRKKASSQNNPAPTVNEKSSKIRRQRLRQSPKDRV